MFWMPQMDKNPVKMKFLIVSPRFHIQPLARTKHQFFARFLDKYKHMMINVGFLQALTLFGLSITTDKQLM